ncbi:MAG: imidazoleglycerol-phosphate dehydratase HisB [Clostridiaceae bacterium]|nr:imidazoleglycerol-phosphate dehydratase HisB [Clostridiaceae bacterium]
MKVQKANLEASGGYGVARCAEVERKTAETAITVRLNLDGTGEACIDSGQGFFDHMLQQVVKFSLIDLELSCAGDIKVDFHHSAEDIGLTLGTALAEALGERRGIRRYADVRVPMDEALAEVCLDFSGRPYLVFRGEFSQERSGEFELCLVREFLQGLAQKAGLTLHVNLLYGYNAHHEAEAIFKALGLALRKALSKDERRDGIPSTKGSLV